MSNAEPRIDPERIRAIVADAADGEREQLASMIARNLDACVGALEPALDDPAVRRWCRTVLLDRLTDQDAARLAERLTGWPDDFRPERRDRSTLKVVARLPLDVLRRTLLDLAASNAAAELWARLHRDSPDDLFSLARGVLGTGGRLARETTLHLLVLDPYGPEYLSRDQQDELLLLAMEDPDEEVRGLAAEVLAADMPERLLERWDSAPLDTSERVRMAFWRAAFVHEPARAVEDVALLILNRDRDLEARRTALLALGENRPIGDVSPVLELLLSGDEQVLAEDAAQLMWRHHRAPNLANAAARSPFESVRAIAERLLHPERGSPAAGGSRPGDPTRTGEIFDQIASTKDWRGPDRDEE